MERVEQLKKKVRDLYESKNKECADWADWLYRHHVFVVADYASKLAKRFGANEELSVAAGMLHDIADARMSRFKAGHEEKSATIARELLQEYGFSESEIKIIVDDALKFHSCHDGQVPQSPEGKVLATADALAHLTTNFYEHALEVREKETTDEQIKKWALEKIERDFNQKIQFDEVREEVRDNYLKAKRLFI